MTRLLKSLLVASVATLALTAAARADDNVSASIGAGYGSVDANGFDADVWNLNGAVNYSFGNPGWNLQGDVQFSTLDFGGAADVDTWGVGASLFWRDPAQGAYGVSVGHNNIEFFTDFDFLSYGAFGEFYTPMWTVGGHVEGHSGDNNFDAWGLGGNVKGYLTSMWSLGGDLGYTEVDNNGPQITTFGVNTEYLLLPSPGLSVGVGYEHGEIDNFANADADIFSINLKLRFGGPAQDTLVGYDRNGTIESPITFPARFAF